MNYILPGEVRAAIRQYLGTRPHDEVAGAINVLMGLEPFTAGSPPPPNESETEGASS